MTTPFQSSLQHRPDILHLAHLPRFARGWAMMQLCMPKLLRDGLLVVVLSSTVCTLLWALRPHVSFGIQLAYSLSIGIVSWAIIDGGRFFIDQDSPFLFPRRWRGLALVTTGVLLGFVVGISIGDAISGRSTLDMLRYSPESFAYMTMFSMAGGFGISFYFYARGKQAYYLAELEIQSRQTTEAKLKLLQSQLDPHMLFNTLANLRVLIQQDPDRAVQMLDQLGDFLRATLSASRAQEHSLAAEFDRLRDYLSLMQIRLGERLQFHLGLPQELTQIKVPTLILQSLVENAIEHGLEPKVGGGTVWVTASKKDDQLILQVSDDGMGFDTEAKQDQATPGFGLTQVRERLQSWYGSQEANNFIAVRSMNTTAILAFGSEKAEKTATTPGCQVTLMLPMRT
jgi:signal transduction histidine kinase